MAQRQENQAPTPTVTKPVTAEDIQRMTEGLKNVHDDLVEKAKIKRRYLMCVYFYCQRCTKDWSVDMWVPKLVPCKCGNQSPRVTQIEKVDDYQDL